MNAEIIAIGSELTSGAKLDTNSQWLSLRLADLGISVARHTTMADDLPMIVRCLHRALDDCDVILITGGLGPTLDDLTRQALAEFTGRPLVRDDASFEQIRALFAARGRPMPARNEVQALFPQGAEPIPNHHGTAPGIWLEVPRPNRDPCRVAAMPGVPYEMHAMFNEQVAPRLPAGIRVLRRAVINAFGVGESQAEQLLGDLTARDHDPEIGITVHEATISLRVCAVADSLDECEQKLAVARQQIRERLGDLVFGEETDELEHAVARLLAVRGETVATAEIGTAGLLSERLCHLDTEQRRVFAGGTVFPHEAAACRWLQVPFGERDAADVALRLATETARRGGSDYGLAVLDWSVDAAASGDTTQRVTLALCGPDVSQTAVEAPFGSPQLQRSRITKAALDLLRRHLLKGTAPGGTP